MSQPRSHPSHDELRPSIHVRESLWDDADTTAVSELVRTYLLQTEMEKIAHGLGVSAAPITVLPQRYEREVEDPRAAYADCTTLLAATEQRPVGVVVVRVDGGEGEIKRLWTDPDLRGRGLGSALLDAALVLTSERVRLTVWEWRAPAIRLYESRGFERATSWDDREGLVCMERPADTVPLR